MTPEEQLRKERVAIIKAQFLEADADAFNAAFLKWLLAHPFTAREAVEQMHQIGRRKGDWWLA